MDQLDELHQRLGEIKLAVEAIRNASVERSKWFESIGQSADQLQRPLGNLGDITTRLADSLRDHVSSSSSLAADLDGTLSELKVTLDESREFLKRAEDYDQQLSLAVEAVVQSVIRKELLRLPDQKFLTTELKSLKSEVRSMVTAFRDAVSKDIGSIKSELREMKLELREQPSFFQRLFRRTS